MKLYVCASASVLAAAVLTACSLAVPSVRSSAKQDQLVEQAVIDDQAAERIENETTLLNIARAALHRPRTYVDISSWAQSTPTMTGKGINEFGGTTGSSVELDAQSDTSTVTITPLTKQEFVRGTTTAITPDMVDYYIQQGYPSSLLLHLFVREIRVYDGKGVLQSKYTNSPLLPNTYKKFDQVVNGLSACAISSGTPDIKVKPDDGVGPTMSAAELQNQVWLTALLSKGYTLVQAPSASTDKKPEKATYFAAKKETQLKFEDNADNHPQLTALCDDAKAMAGLIPAPEASTATAAAAATAAPPAAATAAEVVAITGIYKSVKPEAAKQKDKVPHMELILRSPEALFYYLGEVGREQLHGVYGEQGEWLPDPDNSRILGSLDLRPCLESTSQADCKVRCVPMFILETDAATVATAGGCNLPDSYESYSKDKKIAARPFVKIAPAALDLEKESLDVSYADQKFSLPWDWKEKTDTLMAFTIAEQVIGLQTNASEIPTTGLVKALP